MSKIKKIYKPFENFLSSRRAKMVNGLVPNELKGSRILDIGCGEKAHFLKQSDFKEKYGIDMLVEEQDGMTLANCDIEKLPLPFEDKFFDVVTMLAVFEHIEPDKLTDVLQDVKRLIKPGGRFILTVPSPATDSLCEVLSFLRLVDPQKVKEHKGRYNQDSVVNHLRKAGFENIDCGYFQLTMNSWYYAQN